MSMAFHGQPPPLSHSATFSGTKELFTVVYYQLEITFVCYGTRVTVISVFINTVGLIKTAVLRFCG